MYSSYKFVQEIEHKIKNFLIEKFPSLSGDDLVIIFNKPPQIQLGDLSLKCFDLARKVDLKPNELANLIGSLKLNDLVEKIAVAGPYVNFYLNKNKFSRAILSDVLKNENYGQGVKKKDKIMIEGFGQANTHKALHVGHLRNIFLSASVANLLEFDGYKIIRANYHGDIGAHVAKWLWYFTNLTDQKIPIENIDSWLAELYVKANLKLEEQPEFKKQVDDTLKKIEAGDKDLKRIWKTTCELSLKEFAKIYDLLKIKFDEEFFESDMEKPGKNLVQLLVKQGIAKKSEGAIVVDLEKYNLGTFLLLKSDGSSLYSTKDLALAQIKFKKFKIDQSIYVVDVRQELYLKQLFKTLELMGFKQAQNCYHLAYGFLTLDGQKIASRSGQVVSAKDLYYKIKKIAVLEIEKRHNVIKDEIDKIADQITLASLKFGMLKFSPEINNDYDSVKATQFEGDTGPYLQYAGVRIKSILNKTDVKSNKNLPELKNLQPNEWQIIQDLYDFQLIIRKASQDYNPAILTSYLLKLAKDFSSFYEACSILEAENEERKIWRLNLIQAVYRVLNTGLNLLGIEMPEKM
ncbi:MAG: arginine--tRNA ligase [Patescibacteria group bacterium]|nr:arginine--tRNA ligase [Patescibacteria group bacterium]